MRPSHAKCYKAEVTVVFPSKNGLGTRLTPPPPPPPPPPPQRRWLLLRNEMPIWTLLVYGLLYGTTLMSIYTLALKDHTMAYERLVIKMDSTCYNGY